MSSEDYETTNFHKEFQLVSYKHIFRLEDMSEEERKLYLIYLHSNNEGVIFTEDCIFHPLKGDKFKNYIDGYDVEEIAIRRWRWTCPMTKISHQLLDIFAWPGDNQNGIISINGVPFLDNWDSNLSPIDDKDMSPEAKSFIGNYSDEASRLKFFEFMRNNFNEGPNEPDYEIGEDFYNFVESPEGQEAIRIEDEGYKTYSLLQREDKNHKDELAKIYAHEFQYIRSACEMKRQTDRHKVYSGDHFICWWFKNTLEKYLLVTRYNETFLVNENRKAIRKIYHAWTVMDLNDELAPRIHSYLSLMDTHNYGSQMF